MSSSSHVELMINGQPPVLLSTDYCGYCTGHPRGLADTDMLCRQGQDPVMAPNIRP